MEHNKPDSEKIRIEFQLWLNHNNVSRLELAKESGYSSTYINELMSTKPITKRAEKVIREAMLRIEERKKVDISEIAVKLSPESLSIISQAADALQIPLKDFLDFAVEWKSKR